MTILAWNWRDRVWVADDPELEAVNRRNRPSGRLIARYPRRSRVRIIAGELVQNPITDSWQPRRREVPLPRAA